jgi:hypothetical protein
MTMMPCQYRPSPRRFCETPKLFEPEAEKPLATGVFVVLIAPFLICLEQLPRPDGNRRILDAAFFQKVADNVHLVAVLRGPAFSPVSS